MKNFVHKKQFEVNNSKSTSDIKYIPLRYLWSMFITLVEVVIIIGILIALMWYVPYFYIAIILTQFGCVLSIINSTDNPDYKVPWLVAVLLLPVVGFMLYFIFYRRNMRPYQIRKIQSLGKALDADDSEVLEHCHKQDMLAFSQMTLIDKLASTHAYENTAVQYFVSGEDMFADMIERLKHAKEFIFIDYFIIEQGVVWNEILDILKAKVKEGVEVRVIYDDIGCMKRLPYNYYKHLRELGIDAIIFGRVRAQANSEFNNRNHRKITVIDGVVAYTGGANIADEYANIVTKFGHWKDAGVRIEGDAVNELTRLVLIDYCMARKTSSEQFDKYYRHLEITQKGYCVPFGDGPKPIYAHNVAKSIILNMLSQAKDYVYITTPYLIIDTELTHAIENAALRGIDIRIITPHIPDKKIVFAFTRSFYDRLIKCGVKIYEYSPGFIHQKMYLSDDKFAMIGTINLDYRSLVHHFENGVWLFNHAVIESMKDDFVATLNESIPCPYASIKMGLIKRFMLSIIYIFAPLF